MSQERQRPQVSREVQRTTIDWRVSTTISIAKSFVGRIEEVGTLSYNQLAARTGELQDTLLQHLVPNPKERKTIILGTPDAQQIRTITEFVATEGAKAMQIRHGEAIIPDSIKQLDPAAQKIIAMQEEHNMADQLTPASMAEAAALGLVLRFIRVKTGKPMLIETSRNARAMQAAVIAGAIAEAVVIENPKLTCMNYRKGTPSEIKPLVNPDGTISWEKDAIDGVAEKGKGTFDTIQGNMGMWLVSSLGGNNDTIIRIGLTHSQQLATLAERTQMPIGRIRYFGMQLFSQQEAHLVPNGINMK